MIASPNCSFDAPSFRTKNGILNLGEHLGPNAPELDRGRGRGWGRDRERGRDRDRGHRAEVRSTLAGLSNY